MEACDCVESHFWPNDHEEFLMRWQYLSDCLIAFAYFAITIELVYFVLKSAFFPYRWAFMQFSALTISCGATHLVSACTMLIHSKAMAAVIAVSKISCAAVSFATVVMLVHFIPDLLNVKAREQYLKDKSDELDREMGLILTREESERHAAVLTHKIRSSLNRDTILRTTLVELGKTLGLEDCALWMPSRGGLTLQISHTLNNRIQVGSSIPISLPLVTEVLSTAQAMRVPCNCPLARIMPMVIKGIYQPRPEAVAVRVPLLDLSNFGMNDWRDFSTRSYAIMVLVLPSDGARQWHDHELDMIDVVADQVAVALSHAAILEESMKSCDRLTEQNATLKLAQRETERAIHTRNGFLAVINDEMRTPMSAIIALALLLLETELTPEQRVVIEGILKSSNLLGTFANDVLELSRLEDGKLELDIKTMNLHWLFKEVIKLIKPIASVKKLQMNLILAPDLPVFAIGDKKRLLQTVLNIVGNAVKFTKDGYVSITAAVVGKPESLRDSVSNDAGYFLLRVQVKDSGCGVKAQDKPHLFTKFSRLPNAYLTSNGAGLGLAICKRFVNLMGGHIWIDSDGLDKGTVATFIVKLGVCNNHPTGSSRNGNMVKVVIPSVA